MQIDETFYLPLHRDGGESVGLTFTRRTLTKTVKISGIDIGYHVYHQDAKKVIFTACHSGKLKLTFISPKSFQLTPKTFR